jgi:hypothetical protein
MTTADADRELRRATLLYRLKLAAQLEHRTARTVLKSAARRQWVESLEHPATH